MADDIAERFAQRRSPLAELDPPTPGGWLTAPQPGAIALVDGALEDVLASPPKPVVVLVAGPRRRLLVSETAAAPDARLGGSVTVTDVSHAYFRLRLHGAAGREALTGGVDIDLHPAVFPAGHSTPTAFQDIAIVLHARAPDAFDLYTLRSYAASLWRWLSDAGSPPPGL